MRLFGEQSLSNRSIVSRKGVKLRPRILLFEDNDNLRFTLKLILRDKGFEVFTFSDPRMCPVFDAANHSCPEDHACADIIISDLNMPTKTGLELINERQRKKCKVKYRALMSGDWTDSDLKYAQELGCHILHKPFEINEMLQWLDDCIKNINPERNLSSLLAKPNQTSD
jgi:DNA-binding response OmpR family regulator